MKIHNRDLISAHRAPLLRRFFMEEKSLVWRRSTLVRAASQSVGMHSSITIRGDDVPPPGACGAILRSLRGAMTAPRVRARLAVPVPRPGPEDAVGHELRGCLTR